MSNIIKFINQELGFINQNDIVRLINDLIIQNRTLYDKLPWEIQKYLGANVYGTQLIKQTNKFELYGKNIFDQSQLNQDFKKLVLVLNELIKSNKSLKDHVKAVEEDQKKKEQEKLQIIEAAISQPEIPVISDFIELYKSKSEFNAELKKLHGKNIKIQKAYDLLKKLLDNIFSNKKHFVSISSTIDANSITLDNLQNMLSDTTINKEKYYKIKTISGANLFDAMHNIIQSSIIIIKYLFLTLQEKKWNTEIEMLTNNKKNSSNSIDDILNEFKLNPILSTLDSILNRTRGKSKIKNQTISNINEITSLVLTGGSNKELDVLIDDEKIKKKYLKYKAKYIQLRAQLKTQGNL